MDDVIDNRSCPKHWLNGWRDIVRIYYLPTAYHCIVIQEGPMVMSNLWRPGIFPFLFNGNKPSCYSFMDAGRQKWDYWVRKRGLYYSQQKLCLDLPVCAWSPRPLVHHLGRADAGGPRWMPGNPMNRGAREDAERGGVDGKRKRACSWSRSRYHISSGFSLPTQSWDMTPVKRFQSLRVLADRVKNIQGCSTAHGGCFLLRTHCIIRDRDHGFQLLFFIFQKSR